jgi:hypothetical protein
MKIQFEVPDRLVENIVYKATHIHGAGKLITKSDYTGYDVYRADQDVMDALDVNGDDSVDLDDFSELVSNIGDALSNLFS